MTAKGHIMFSLASILFFRRAKIFSTLTYENWLYVILSSTLASLFPDLDHSKSFLGRRLFFISFFTSKLFRHRGFTHSIFFVYIIMIPIIFFQKYITSYLSIYYAIIIGYISHIIGDLITPSGVSIFWPCRYRFKLKILPSSSKKNFKKVESFFCVLILMLSLFYKESNEFFKLLFSKKTVFILINKIIKSLYFYKSLF